MWKQKKVKILSFSFIILLCITMLSFYMYIWISDPLKTDGWSNYNKEHKRIYLSLINNGFIKMEIEKVTVNSGKQPEQLNLVMSYTGQIVSAGIEENPQARIIGIDEGFIHPKLSENELRDLINNNTQQLPLHYGVLIINKENIESIRIKYKYFGISKTLNVNLEQGN
ncbi:hypothetical protein [Paenibacillus lentus]|uniref:Uncharacterized protein n=1 Tax=Paenibacillus lentus TaxID=1338368 RepID=A0A3Q8S3L0_9BACL|nr:hypothetical protein [Paenibacillus lentus]AZK45141.1 hypothetical protein EIM92_02140 [Paenibacillus lentus]